MSDAVSKLSRRGVFGVAFVAFVALGGVAGARATVEGGEAAKKPAKKSAAKRQAVIKTSIVKSSKLPHPSELSIPLVGDESSFGDYLTDPAAHVGQTLIFAGLIEPHVYHAQDYEVSSDGTAKPIGPPTPRKHYVHKYADAEETHAAFQLWPVDAKMRTAGTLALYMSHEIAEELTNALSKNKGDGRRKGGDDGNGDGRLPVRVKVVRLADRHHDGDGGETLELIDWQPLSADGDSWGKWQVKAKARERAKAAAKASAKSAD